MTLANLLSRNLIDGKYRQLITVTLAAKCIYTTKDVLDMHNVNSYKGIGSKKAALIHELQNDIRQIIAFESGETFDVADDKLDGNQSVNVNYLPMECPRDATVAELISLFITEFCKHMEQRFGDNISKMNRFIAIKRRYLDGLSIPDILCDSQITVKSRESLRLKLVEFSTDVSEVINTEIQNPHHFKKKYGIDNILLHPTLVLKLREVIDFIDDCHTDVEFKKMLGCKSNSPIVDFTLHMSDKKICKLERTLLKERFITPVDSSELIDGISMAFDKLELEIEPYHELELKRFLLTKISGRKEIVVNTICKILKHSSQFEKVEKKFQLKWSQLHSVQTRVERILYESGREMTKEEISLEYDTRAMAYGVDIPKIKKYEESDKIAAVRNGVWRWRRHEDVQRINIQEVVQRFIATHKRVSAKDVYGEVLQYVTNPNEKSIKAYITNCAYETFEHDYILKECRKEFKDTEFYILGNQLLQVIVSVMPTNGSFCDLEDITNRYERQYCKLVRNKRLIYNCCHENADIFDSMRKPSRGRPVSFRLKPNYDKVLEDRLNDKPITRKTKHTQQIINEAINILQSQDNNTMSQVELVRLLRPLIPKNKPLTLIYKIFKDIIFVKSGDGRSATISLNTDFYPRKSSVVPETTSMEMIPVEQQSRSDATTPIIRLTDKELDNIRDGVHECIESHLQWIERDGMGIRDFNTAWNALIKICGVGAESVKGAFQRTFRLLHKYLFSATDMDDRFYLYDELNRRYEEYISKISLDNQSTLSKQIDLARSKSLLPASPERYCNINKYISNLIYYRNGPAHKNGKTPPDSYMINAICQALTLYLYVADKAYINGYIHIT